MNADEVREGQAVRISTDRQILGRTWRGIEGVVRYTFRRDAGVPDWVTVQVPDSGFVLIGFAPDEVEPS